jgi:hypothetical protein
LGRPFGGDAAYRQRCSFRRQKQPHPKAKTMSSKPPVLVARAISVLALGLLAAPTAGQARSMPFLGGELIGSILPAMWQGRPALIVITGGGNTFLAYSAQSGRPRPLPVRFELVAAYFDDPRPCAVGAPVNLNVGDFFKVAGFGPMGANGTLTFAGSVLLDQGQYPNPWVYDKKFEVSYCEGGGWCYSGCVQPGYYDKPRLAAFVLIPTN